MALEIEKASVSSGSLGKRGVQGVAWMLLLRVISNVMSWTCSIILARLLSSEDFGLVSIAMIVTTVLETFSTIGFDHALIQSNDEVSSYLDTAWTTSVARGALLAAILFFSAPVISFFFQEPNAILIVRAFAAVIFLRGVQNIGIIVSRKNLDFQKLFIYQLSGILVNFLVSIPLALSLRSAWAIVIGVIASDFASFAMSYVIHPYRPRLVFKWDIARKLFGFGHWIFGSRILHFLFNEADDIFVGRLFGTSALGFYRLAYRLSSLPATEITSIASKVAFPLFSKIQDDLPRLRSAYFRNLKLIMLLAFPLSLDIILLGPEFTRIFLGNKWMPMVPVLQVLAVWGAMRAIRASTGSVILAIGRPDIATKSTALKVALLAALIYPFSVSWGITGTAFAVVIGSAVELPILLAFVLRSLGISFRKCGRLAILVMLCLLAMGGAVFFTVQLVNFSNSDVFGFLIVAFVGVLAYTLAVFVTERVFGLGLQNEILYIKNHLFSKR